MLQRRGIAPGWRLTIRNDFTMIGLGRLRQSWQGLMMLTNNKGAQARPGWALPRYGTVAVGSSSCFAFARVSLLFARRNRHDSRIDSGKKGTREVGYTTSTWETLQQAQLRTQCPWPRDSTWFRR